MPTNEFVDHIYNGGKDVILTLLDVNVGGTHYYYVNNTESITSSVTGTPQVYQRGMFEITLPDDTSEGLPSAKISFGVADIQIVRFLREAEEKLIIDLWLVLASDPNAVEYGPVNYQSSGFSISDGNVSLDLEAEPILDVKLPSTHFTPRTAPGLWDTR